METDDKLPPNVVESEAGLISCVLISNGDALDAAAIVPLEAFFELRNREFFKILRNMREAGKPIELVSVFQELRLLNQLEPLGGTSRIDQLFDLAPSAEQAPMYVSEIMECHRARKTLQACVVGTKRLQSRDGTDYGSIMRDIERDVVAASTSDEPLDHETLPLKFIDDYVAESEMGDTVESFRTGFPTLDFGKRLEVGDMVVIGARPSVGKTALALNIALNMSGGVEKVPVGIISLEMSTRKIRNRMISITSRVLHRIVSDPSTHRDATPKQIEKITDALGRIRVMPMVIDDRAGRSMAEIASAVRRWTRVYKTKVVIVDYLGLVRVPDRVKRFEAVATFSTMLKGLARELGIVVIVVVQLNRETGSPNERPKIWHIRDSGAIEQDADQILLLQSVENDENTLKIHRDKCRDGPQCSFNATFDKTTGWVGEVFDVPPVVIVPKVPTQPPLDLPDPPASRLTHPDD